jgi:predicted NUDIX family NTP pyrophosphohydrolase
VPKRSAGLLLYRVRDGVVEVLIGYPGGPIWARRDDGALSILKGEYIDGDDPWARCSGPRAPGHCVSS